MKYQIIRILLPTILLYIGLFKCFEKIETNTENELNIRSWKGIVPIYNDYLIYKLIWKIQYFFIQFIISLAGIIGICLGARAASYLLLEISTNELSLNSISELGFGPRIFILGLLFLIVSGIISIIKDVKFAHLFDVYGFKAFLFVLFKPIYILIIGFGKRMPKNPTKNLTKE